MIEAERESSVPGRAEGGIKVEPDGDIAGIAVKLSEAGVNMLLPAVLVMVATVLIIIGPFFLNYLYFGLSL